MVGSRKPSLATTARRGPNKGWLLFVAGAAVVMLLLLADRMVGDQQARIIQESKDTKANLEKMSWYYLRADIVEVVYTAERGYRFTVWMENVFPEFDMYVMLPAPRIYLQVGSQWIEVPARDDTADPALQEGTVVNLKERITVDWVMDHPEDVDYFELLEGYMHVQVQNSMFVSPEQEPKEHIVERNDFYYVHLKPIGADDAHLATLHNFPGPLPVFIPMPPH